MHDLDDPAQLPPPIPSRGYFALLSLLCGMVLCIPPTALAAFIFGVVALRSKKRQIGGRPAAWAGIVLSSASIAFIAWFIYSSFILAGPAGRFATQFINNLAANRMEAAASQCDPEVTPDELKLWSSQVQTLTPPLKVDCTQTLYQSSTKPHKERLAYTIGATVTDAKGTTRTFQFGLLRSDGEFRVWNFK